MGIIQERPFIIPFHLGAVDSPDSQIHLCQAPGSQVAFLPINRNII